MAHLKAKQAGLPPQPKQSWAVPRRAINLMEALRRSIGADQKAEASRRAPPARKRAMSLITLSPRIQGMAAGLRRHHSFEPPDARRGGCIRCAKPSKVARHGTCDVSSSLCTA